MVFGLVTSDGDVILPFIISHGFRLNTREGGRTHLDREGGYWNNATSGHQTLCQSSIGCEKISETTSPLTSGHLTPQIEIPLIIMCGARLSESPTKL